MDQTQLEKTFSSTNKIKSVYAFVRGCLREDVKSIKFILCKLPASFFEHYFIEFLQINLQSEI